MKVSVLVPYRYSSLHKQKLFDFVMSRIYCTLGWNIVVGDAPGEFSRGGSINRAAELSDADVFVLCDADTIANPEYLQAAVDIAPASGWVLPYTMYYNLDEIETEHIVTSPSTIRLLPPKHSIHALDYVVSGILVLSREAFEAVGGYDERFIDWGFEDDAFASSLKSLVGPTVRIEGFVSHLWHPIENATGNPFDHPFIDHNRALGLRYLKAQRDPVIMKALVAERSS